MRDAEKRVTASVLHLELSKQSTTARRPEAQISQIDIDIFLVRLAEHLLRGGCAACAALLEREELLGAERLVVDLRRRLDEILKMGPAERSARDSAWYDDVPREEVAQVVELAVRLVLDVDHAPSVLPPSHGLAVDNHVALGPDDGKGDHVSDGLVERRLVLVVLLVVEGVRPNVVVHQLGSDLRQDSISVSGRVGRRTLCLNSSRSSSVSESLLAITGTTLTTSESFFITVMSIALREWPVGLIK